MKKTFIRLDTSWLKEGEHLRLTGRLIKGTKTVKEISFEKEQGALTFREVLEECFIGVCRELDIQVPLWLKKNSSEFAQFRRTFFSREQFTERVYFDRFEIRLE
jgi:hypothetical protein